MRKYFPTFSHLPAILILLSIFSLPSFAQTTFDPSYISVGARSLGMGKAGAALAEDSDTLFINPAGLGEFDSFHFTSMSGKLLEDVNYIMLGAVYPLGGKTSMGIGYVTTAVPGIELRNNQGAFQKTAIFNNSLLIGSFGQKLTDSISLGLNIKYFVQNGTEIDTGNGNGFNLDLGILQYNYNWFSWGMVLQNALNSMGISYKNGETETFPTTLKIGTRIHLLGEDFESAYISPNDLSILADADFAIHGSLPVTFHIGAEFSPLSSLTLRAGIDQDLKTGGVQGNLTAGVTYKICGVGFHYAYHPYLDNISHYFSISFDERGWPEEGRPDAFIASRR